MAPYLAPQCPDCSVLVVPLLAESNVLGALVLIRPADAGPFERGTVTRIRTLADLASIALQRLAALAEGNIAALKPRRPCAAATKCSPSSLTIFATRSERSRSVRRSCATLRSRSATSSASSSSTSAARLSA